MAVLTRQDLIDLWQSVTDQGYSQPLLENPESGVEAIEQAAEQLARASQMVERTTQSLYLLPWSGQTYPPAGGARLATVVVEVSRTGGAKDPVVLQAGTLLFEQLARDFSKDGPVEVRTGRRYRVVEDAVFGPGQLGPIEVSCEAEKPGAGYNIPAPGELSAFVQPGKGLGNDRAAVVPGPGAHRLVVRNDPDVVVPEHVGQYVELTAGTNAGQRRRVIGYEAPDLAVPHGGVAILAATTVFRSLTMVGALLPGEIAEQLVSLARIRILKVVGIYVVADVLVGTLVTGQTLTGVQSTASASVDAIEQSGALAAESGTAAWRVLGWDDDLAITASNSLAPEGGRSPVLDEIGDERLIPRSPGEDDEVYRQRVATPADVVTPNALRRAANRVLAPIGLEGCLREVGLELFRGLFYDGDPSSNDPAIAFAYDMDGVARPEDRFKLQLDYLEFRAFFLMGVPPISIGEFGVPYDSPHANNAYDAAPYNAFFDGFPVGAAIKYRGVWQELMKAKAGGVGFDLYVEDVGCF